MTSILISEPPEQVANILNGKQSIIISKTAPKEWKDYISEKSKEKPKPKTGYVYCTNPHAKKVLSLFTADFQPYLNTCRSICNGRVVASFTLMEVEKINCETYPSDDSYQFRHEYFPEKSTEDEILRKSCISGLEPYLDGCEGYAWHISDLQIFDKPKNIWEFEHVGGYLSVKDCPKKEKGFCNMGFGVRGYSGCDKARLKRPPKPWCYVEELQ